MILFFSQVTNTAGVEYNQIITWQLTIFGMFIVVIVAMFNYMNTRFTESTLYRRRIEDKLDKLTMTQSAEFNDLKMSMFLIKDKLGIPLVAEKPDSKNNIQEQKD
jgi:hypothetical protein